MVRVVGVKLDEGGLGGQLSEKAVPAAVFMHSTALKPSSETASLPSRSKTRKAALSASSANGGAPSPRPSGVCGVWGTGGRLTALAGAGRATLASWTSGIAPSRHSRCCTAETDCTV